MTNLEKKLKAKVEKVFAVRIFAILTIMMPFQIIMLIAVSRIEYLTQIGATIYVAWHYFKYKEVLAYLKENCFADSEESCREIAKSLKKVELNSDYSMLRWRVNTGYLYIAPVVAILPHPTFFQAILNLIREPQNRKYEFMFAVIKENGCQGEFCSADNVFSSFSGAVQFLDLLKEQRRRK